MFRAILIGALAASSGASVSPRAYAERPDAVHVAFALRADLSNDQVRETYSDLLTLVLAHGKGELHRAPGAKTGHAVLGADSLEGVLALSGLEFISAKGTARDGMQVGEYRVALARELTTEQSRDVAARVFELAHGKLIANVTHYFRLGQFIARIPRANLDLIRSLDGIASVTPSGAEARSRRACEPELL